MFMESKRFPIPNMASVEEFKVRFSAINVEKEIKGIAVDQFHQ